MPHLQREWVLHIRSVFHEYQSARVAVDHVADRLQENANFLEGLSREKIARVSHFLEGTYVVRVFAAFESALRSYEQWWHPGRPMIERPTAATMIDQIGAHEENNVAHRRKRTIGLQIRERVHEARKTRNFWAHDDEKQIELPLPIEQVTDLLLAYVRKMPLEWA